MPFYVKLSWNSTKTANAENKRHQTAWDKHTLERKRISKVIKNV